jgi:hypothetical protein
MITEFYTRSNNSDASKPQYYSCLELCNRSGRTISPAEVGSYSLALSKGNTIYEEGTDECVSIPQPKDSLYPDSYQYYKDTVKDAHPFGSMLCFRSSAAANVTYVLHGENIRSTLMDLDLVQQAEPTDYILLLDSNKKVVDCVQVPAYDHTIVRRYPEDRSHLGGNAAYYETVTVDSPNPTFVSDEWLTKDLTNVSLAVKSHTLGQRPSVVTGLH